MCSNYLPCENSTFNEKMSSNQNDPPLVNKLKQTTVLFVRKNTTAHVERAVGRYFEQTTNIQFIHLVHPAHT
jgi:hypothetical protein